MWLEADGCKVAGTVKKAAWSPSAIGSPALQAFCRRDLIAAVRGIRFPGRGITIHPGKLTTRTQVRRQISDACQTPSLAIRGRCSA